MFPKLEGLDSLARRDGVDIRPTLLRVLTDLYVQRPAHTGEEERHYVELGLRLIDAVDVATRVTVARKLAAYPGAPLAVVRRLARDVIEVAEPILAQSRVLGDSELAAIIKDYGLSHAAAIARRHARPTVYQDAPDTPERLSAAPPALPEKTREPDLDLAELFFSADSAGRRVLLMNLADADEPRVRAAPDEAVSRLEIAALSRDTNGFVSIMETSLGLTRAHAQRLVADASGEPLLIAPDVQQPEVGPLIRDCWLAYPD